MNIDINEIKEKIKNFALETACVDFAILFGSFAKGRENKLSDIDVAVSFAKDTPEEEYMLEIKKLYSIIENSSKRNADVVVIKNTFENPLLYHNIFFNGEVLFSRNNEKFCSMKRQAVHEYEDTKSIREMAYLGQLAKQPV